MRTFSRLRALCSHPETLERPSARRDAAAELGTQLHKWVENWRHCHMVGEATLLPEEDPVRGWAMRMMRVWTPPDDLEVEVAMGLADAQRPFYVPVLEKEPHVYVAADGAKLLTAGRADLLWPEATLDGLIIRVADVKTGITYLGDPGLLRQVLAQGFAACERDGVAEGFVPGIYYARLGLFDWGAPILRGTPAWDRAWSDVYSAAVMTSEPKPGGWCLGCWDKKLCAANPEATL